MHEDSIDRIFRSDLGGRVLDRPANDRGVASLQGVGKFVGDEMPAAGRLRLIAPMPECDLIADGVRDGSHGSRGVRGARVRVYPHAAEVMPEAFLHERASRRIQRLTPVVQHLVHGRGHLM